MDDSFFSLIKLTSRESEVLKHLTNGLSDKEIANELSLSINTVKWYNRRIYAKLGVSNRTQAVTRSLHLHLF